MLKTLLSSKLVKNSGIYTITSLINSMIPFLMMPILTRYLTPKDYGTVSMFGVLLGIVAPFLGASTATPISRVYFDREYIDIKVYIANCLIILFFSVIIIFFLFLMFGFTISNFLSLPIIAIWAALIIGIYSYTSQIVLMLWQVREMPIKYGGFQIIGTILGLSFSIAFVVGIGMDWRGRVLGQVITSIIMLGIAIYVLIKDNWLKFTYNRDYIKHALSVGVPMIPHTLGGLIMVATDRIFITRMVGIESTGLYSVGNQIAMIIGLLATSFNQAYSPWLFAKLKLDDNRSKIKIAKLTYIYFIVILFFAIALSIIAPWFLSFFVGEKFSDSSDFVFWIALGGAFTGMYYMVCNYIFYAQKTSILAKITFLSSIINIGLNYLLIKINGAIGAAQATALTSMIFFLLTWFISAKVYKMPWKINEW